MMIRIDVNVDEIVGVIQSIQSIISCLEEKQRAFRQQLIVVWMRLEIK